jgi:proteasome lid subunit RPN8/RPN11
VVPIHPDVLRVITKHAGHVYPAEGYGILLGHAAPLQAVCALPVGRTARWYATEDRFASIPDAVLHARTVAAHYKLDVVGTYHTDAGGHPDVPNPRLPPEKQALPLQRGQFVARSAVSLR